LPAVATWRSRASRFASGSQVNSNPSSGLITAERGGVMVFLGELEYRRQRHVRGREFREEKGNGGIMGEDGRCKAAGTSV
jgi:hypothetical protein